MSTLDHLDREGRAYGGTHLIGKIAPLVWRLERYAVAIAVGLAMIALLATLTSRTLAIGGTPFILHGAITAAMARSSRVAKCASLASSMILTTVALTFALLVIVGPKGGETAELALFLEGAAMIIAALVLPPIAYFFCWLENR